MSIPHKGIEGSNPSVSATPNFLKLLTPIVSAEAIQSRLPVTVIGRFFYARFAYILSHTAGAHLNDWQRQPSRCLTEMLPDRA